MRAGWIRPSETSFSSVIRPTSRRTGSKQASSTASGVSSMIRLTPVTDEKALLSALDLQQSVSCLTLSLTSKPCRFLLRGLATLQRRVSRLDRCFSLRSLGLPTCVIQDCPRLLLRRTEQTGRLFPLVDRAHGEAHDDANEDSHDDAGQHNGLLCAPPGRNVQPVQGRWAWPPTIGPLERQQRRAAARRCEASLDYDPKAASMKTATCEGRATKRAVPCLLK